jgi:hypothetical protein
MERSESENWYSVRASNEGLKKNWWFKKHEHEGESETFLFLQFTQQKEKGAPTEPYQQKKFDTKKIEWSATWQPVQTEQMARKGI